MTGCAFCDRKNFESRIIHETDKFFVVATLGQITDGGYVLIIPKNHVSCIAELESPEIGPLLMLMGETAEVTEKEYGQPIGMFEHGIVGQSIPHAHLHIFPGLFTAEITDRVKNDFPCAETDILPIYEKIFPIYQENREAYLFWQDENGLSHICWNPPAPQQYLRVVLANVLGRPERAYWRKMDQELDKKLVAETIFRLKPYFV